MSKSAEWRATRLRVWGRDGGTCGICGLAVEFGPKMHLDHIVPRGAGGSGDDDNLRPSHAKCNQGLNRGGYRPHYRILGKGANRKSVLITPKLGERIFEVEPDEITYGPPPAGPGRGTEGTTG